MRVDLVAPCGMNCRLCRAYVRAGRPCPGCRGDDSGKPKTRVLCPVKTCPKIMPGGIRYCFDCDSFPCASVIRLDKRYRTRYGVSMVDNLEHIKSHGVRSFIRNEKRKWTCPGCSELLCLHEPTCAACGYRWRQAGD